MLQKQSLSLASHGLYFIFSFCWRSLSAWLVARMWSRMRSGLETWRGLQTSRWDPSWPREFWCRGVSRTRWPAAWRRLAGGRGTGGTYAGHRPWFQSCFLNLITMGLVLNDSLFLFCTHCILHCIGIVVCTVNNPYQWQLWCYFSVCLYWPYENNATFMFLISVSLHQILDTADNRLTTITAWYWKITSCFYSFLVFIFFKSLILQSNIFYLSFMIEILENVVKNNL